MAGRAPLAQSEMSVRDYAVVTILTFVCLFLADPKDDEGAPAVQPQMVPMVVGGRCFDEDFGLTAAKVGGGAGAHPLSITRGPKALVPHEKRFSSGERAGQGDSAGGALAVGGTLGGELASRGAYPSDEPGLGRSSGSLSRGVKADFSSAAWGGDDPCAGVGKTPIRGTLKMHSSAK